MARKKATASRAHLGAETYTWAATLLKHASDATRLLVLRLLSEHGEMHVATFCEELHQSQPAINHHLTLLRLGGLVLPRRAGQKVYYSLTERGAVLAGVVGKLID